MPYQPPRQPHKRTRAHKAHAERNRQLVKTSPDKTHDLRYVLVKSLPVDEFTSITSDKEVIYSEEYIGFNPILPWGIYAFSPLPPLTSWLPNLSMSPRLVRSFHNINFVCTE